MFPWPTPQPPDWRIDWAALDASCAWVHTHVIAEALAELPAWRELPEHERELVFSAALLRDLARPQTTSSGDDHRITARVSSKRAEVAARGLLWERDVEPQAREAVCALIRYHQLPLFLIERADPTRGAFAASLSSRCEHLALLAEAEARGSGASNQERLLTNIALFRELCAEHHCLTQPRAFPSDHSRVTYFRTPGRDPSYLAHDDTRCEVTMLSGLPGVGKNTWVARNAGDRPVVSLDDVRRELDAEPSGPQGAVAHAARERCRELLRSHTSFVLNATHLSREIRSLWLNLLFAYRARVRIVYVEASRAIQAEQNRNREARVPEAAVRRMMERWEVPDLTEAHQVQWVLQP